MVVLLMPLVAHANQRVADQLPRCPEEIPPPTVALGQANSFLAHYVRWDIEPAWDIGAGCYIWQQPGVALTITAQWTLEQPIAELEVLQELGSDFIQAQSNLVSTAPFHYPGEAEYGPDGENTPEQVCLLWAAEAAERYAKHLENYRMWIGFNEGMEFIEPQTAAGPDAAVVYIHAGGALEFYFAYDQEGNLRLTHLMVYDYFSA